MPSFSNVRRVPFTPRQMFDLVADIERYPEFLPMCDSLTVLSRDGNTLTARMSVGYKAVSETFACRVSLKPEDLSIVVEYVDGPFRKLENRWRFLPVPSTSEPALSTAADVDFYVDYEFKSPLLAILMGAMFDKAFRQFSAAFETRASAIYGPPSVSAGA
jgi:coenzyme Q-binding protein COQ10